MPRAEVGAFPAPTKFGAEDYTPEITKVKCHWKMPLIIHREIPETIHWTSDNPFGNTTDKLNSIGNVKLPLNIHWNMPLKVHDVFRGVDFWRANILSLDGVPGLAQRTLPYYARIYYTISYYTILCNTILYYTILYYTILYSTILYYTILYYAKTIL